MAKSAVGNDEKTSSFRDQSSEATRDLWYLCLVLRCALRNTHGYRKNPCLQMEWTRITYHVVNCSSLPTSSTASGSLFATFFWSETGKTRNPIKLYIKSLNTSSEVPQTHPKVLFRKTTPRNNVSVPSRSSSSMTPRPIQIFLPLLWLRLVQPRLWMWGLPAKTEKQWRAVPHSFSIY